MSICFLHSNNISSITCIREGKWETRFKEYQNIFLSIQGMQRKKSAKLRIKMSYSFGLSLSYFG